MDYSKLSDFEINCEVLAVFSPDINHMCLSGDNTCFYDCGPTGEGWNQIDIPDYCNNPADAWSIIVANQISILYEEAIGKWNAGKAYWVDGVEWQITDDVMDKNPLRAAMIVFLMMQDH